MSEHLVVPQERVGIELDEFLCLQFPFLSKGRLRRRIREGDVLVDGQPSLPGRRLRAGQVISIELEGEGRASPPVAPSTPLEILAESSAWLAVNKPAGLAVEPERWDHDAASVSGGLLELASSRSKPSQEGRAEALDERFRAVHRIDKDTTGVLLVAKSIEAERYLRRAFQNGWVDKTYLALVEGEFPVGESGEELIDMPLAPDPRRVGRMVVRSKGKPSRTRVRVAQSFRGYTLLACSPQTGRTHQIRVHLAEAGFPLVVDPLYGRRDAFKLSEIKRGYKAKRGREERPLIERLTLHAASLEFPFRTGSEQPEPAADDYERVEAPLAGDFRRVLAQLSKLRAL